MQQYTCGDPSHPISHDDGSDGHDNNSDQDDSSTPAVTDPEPYPEAGAQDEVSPLHNRRAVPRQTVRNEESVLTWIIRDWTRLAAGVPRSALGTKTAPESGMVSLKDFLDSNTFHDPLNNKPAIHKQVFGIGRRHQAKHTSTTKTMTSLALSSAKRRCVSQHLQGWPAGTLPSEIFDMIMTHICRDDVKSLRLVCREFEQKTASFFRTAVLQFSSEIYGPEDPTVDKHQSHQKAQIFQERGWSIRHFALKFEFCEGMCSQILLSLSIQPLLHNLPYSVPQTFTTNFTEKLSTRLLTTL